MRWISPIKEVIGMSLQELSRAVEDRKCGHDSFIGSSGVGSHSLAHDNNMSKSLENGIPFGGSKPTFPRVFQGNS